MKAQKNNYAPETKNLIKRNSNERQPQKRLTRSGRPHEIFNLEENPSPLLGEMSLNKRKNEDNNHFFKEELGKEKEKGQITISGLQRSENGYLFCVKTQNRKEWIEHGWVKDNFPK